MVAQLENYIYWPLLQLDMVILLSSGQGDMSRSDMVHFKVNLLEGINVCPVSILPSHWL